MTRKQNVIPFPTLKGKPAKGAYSYEVETGAPPPPPRSCARRYPFSKMEVGDSFVALLGDRMRIMSAAGYQRRTYGKAFTSRKINDTEIRVWRVK